MKYRFSIIDFLALIILVIWILVSLWSLVMPPMANAELSQRLLPPSQQFWFGTDSLGRQVLDLLILGAKTSFLVSFFTVFLSLCIGLPLGAFSGFYGGLVDKIISKIIDILLSFPPLILPLTIVAFLGQDLRHIILTLSLTGWMSYARLSRGQYAFYRNHDLVLACRVIGASDGRIMFKHLLPNIIPSLMIQATASLEGVILAEAGLSFLGLGGGTYYVSWGSMLSDGQNYLFTHPYLVFFPAFVLFLIVFALNTLSERIRKTLNPKES